MFTVYTSVLLTYMLTSFNICSLGRRHWGDCLPETYKLFTASLQSDWFAGFFPNGFAMFFVKSQ